MLRKRVVVYETAELFWSPPMQQHIESEIVKSRWIYRVMDGTQEADQVLYSNDHYMIIPDRDALNDSRVLNWMVIFKDQQLRSVRDLRGSHLDMLRAVKDQLGKLIDGPLMLYFHKPASVWQLHLHVASPCDAIRTTNDVQKVLFLEDCISFMELDPNFFHKVTMTYMINARHPVARILNQ